MFYSNCTIFIGSGDSKTSYTVPNSSLWNCVMLASFMKQSDSHDQWNEDTHIKLHEAVDIKAEDFKAVATFLIKGNFAPHLAKGRKGQAVVS